MPFLPATATFRQSEREWQATVIRYAELMGWHHWHDRATSARIHCPKCKEPIRLPRNAAGLPDLILVRRPRVVWAELKSERGVVSSVQADWIAALRACGQEVYIWRPSQWSEVERVLR